MKVQKEKTSRAPEASEKQLLVIGVGLPRTGTTSLKLALQEVLGGKCFHGYDILSLSDEQLDFWIKALHRVSIQVEEWQHVFAQHRATVDLPSILFYKELLEAFPEAKVIFTDRAVASWYSSWWSSIGAQLRIINSFPVWLIMRLTENHKVRGLHEAARSYMPPWFHMNIDEAFSSPALAQIFYDSWKRDVFASVPREQLLIFDVTSGWQPLCEFLEVPVPPTPFPHSNDSATFQKQLKRMQHVGLVITSVTAALILWFLYTSMF